MQLGIPQDRFALFIAALWFFPIGALVMRRHLVAATGSRLVIKVVLYGLAWITAPFALFITGIHFLAFAVDTFETLRMLLGAAFTLSALSLPRSLP